METLHIDLEPLAEAASAGWRIDPPAGLMATELLIALTAAAVRETAGDLELLQSLPTRDDAEFGDRPRPEAVTQLEAWLYSASHRVAYAVHTPDWSPPAGEAGSSSEVGSWSGPDGWAALLREHLHGDFHAGHGWTAVNAAAMPVRRPFDEPGLRVLPLLSLWAPVSRSRSVPQQLDDCFCETMTASVRQGRPYVVAVRVFSAAGYLRRLTGAGRRRLELGPGDRRPSLSPSGW